MKSITIHNLDSRLAALIQRKAGEKKLSLNKTIKLLLRQALGLSPEEPEDRKEIFRDLFGVWSEEDFAAFERTTSDFEQIDPEDWQ